MTFCSFVSYSSFNHICKCLDSTANRAILSLLFQYFWRALYIYIYIYIYTHTHTYTHIYIYIYIYIDIYCHMFSMFWVCFLSPRDPPDLVFFPSCLIVPLFQLGLINYLDFSLHAHIWFFPFLFPFVLIWFQVFLVNQSRLVLVCSVFKERSV